MAIKAVIFDLDGTITQPLLDFELIRTEIGLDADSGPILEAMKNMTETERLKAEQILLKHEQLAAQRAQLNDGAEDLLRNLRDNGVKIGILTRNTRENAQIVAEMHKLEFDEIVDREDGPAKPDPFGVLFLCDKFKVKPHEAIVVGDYVFDLMSGKNAGSKAVLIKNHKKADEFLEYADYVIENLAELKNILDHGRS